MEERELLNYICEKLNNNQDVSQKFNLDNITYEVNFIGPNSEKGINISSIIIIPLINDLNREIMLEANNLETNNFNDILNQGVQTGLSLVNKTRCKPCPIIIPLLPSEKNQPYFQQLSRECFNLLPENKYYRLDEQVVKIIDLTKSILENKHKIKAKDKIFLNGYSSSGVFAQRFALLQPQLIEYACIGGASGSIPLISTDIEYPIGIKDYQILFGKNFDMDSYTKIKFKYYVAEFETINKSNSRFDENNMPAPMHDMSFFDRSVPYEVGKKQRQMLGAEMFDRANKTIEYLQNKGINISQKIILGRTHNNFSGIGVNELGDKFFREVYKDSLAYQNEYIKVQ